MTPPRKDMWSWAVALCQPPNKALQPTPLSVGAGFAGHAPCGAAELSR